jgi:O-antigen/teichoic acid export membrane protein
MLGPEGKGSLYLVQFVSSSAVILLNLGLGPAAVFLMGRRQDLPDSEIGSGIFWASLLLGSLPLLVSGVAWQWVLRAASGRMTAQLLWLTIMAIPGMTLTLNASYLSLARDHTLNFNLMRASSAALLLVCLVAALPWGHYSVARIALLWLACAILPAIYSAWLIQQAGGLWVLPSRSLLRDALHFGWRSHLGAVTQYLQHRIDVILVGFFLPLRELGLYSLAVGIAELLWYVPHTVATVLLPHVAASSEEDSNRFTTALCRVLLPTTGALAFALGIAATWLIPRFLPAFRPSVAVLYVLIPGAVAASVFKVLSSDLNGRGKPLETFRPPALSAAVCFVIGAVAIPRYGILGAAAVTTTGYFLNTVLYLRAYSRITRIRARRLLWMDRQDLLALCSLCQSVSPLPTHWFRQSAKSRPIES